jgi:nucleotide-binding universal stress UspA family protein
VSRIVGRVVVGVSGSPESLHALRHAVELARQYDALLIAVNAQPTGGRVSHEWQHTASLVIRDAFEEGLGGLPRDVECTLLAAPGEPGAALLKVADRTNDVLVLGAAHGGSGGLGDGGGNEEPPAAADTDPRLPGRRQFLPALWRRHVKPVLEPDDARVAAHCLRHAVCSVLSVPPPPLAAPARAHTRLRR